MNFDLISDDLICHVLSFLEASEICRGPARTCHRLRNICQGRNVWESVKASGALSDSALYGLCSFIATKIPTYDIRSLELHSKSLTAAGFSNAMWEIPSVVENLQRLDLSGCTSLDPKLLKWIRGCSQLRELRLSGCPGLVSNASVFQACASFYGLEPVISRIEVLDMRDVVVPIQVFSKLSGPKLKTLMISAYPVIEPDPSTPFFQGFPALENVYINYGGKSSNFFSLASLGLPPSVRVLEIPGYPIRLSETEPLACLFPHLRVLKVRAVLDCESSASCISDLHTLEHLSLIQKRNHVQRTNLDLSRCVSLQSVHLSLKVPCVVRDFGLARLPCLSEVKLNGLYDVRELCSSLKGNSSLRRGELLIRSPQEISFTKALEHIESLVIVENYVAKTTSTPPPARSPVVAVPHKVKVCVEGPTSKHQVFMHRRGSSFRDLFQGYCTRQRIYRHQALFTLGEVEVTDMMTSRDLGLQKELKLSCRLL